MVKKIALLISLTISFLIACTEQPEYQQVSLEVAPVDEITSTADDALRIAVAAVISPEGTTLSYSPLLDFLGKRLNQPATLIQRQTYAEVNSLLQSGEVDLAFICTGAYVQGGEELDVELLAAPQVDGETVYYSYIIVPAASDIESFTDLRGKTFAFTDPLSNTGKLSTTHILWQQDETPENYFNKTIYTFSHDNSIRAVADGLVDGASVDSLVYDYLIEREPQLLEQVRIIKRSVPYGIPPVVVPSNADEEFKKEARQALLTMQEDADGRKILDSLGIERFVVVDDSTYDSVRDMLIDLEQIP